MAGRWNLVILALYLSLVMVLSLCPNGRKSVKQVCVDFDECEVDESDEIGPCGEDALCLNTIGSFYCQCANGYKSSTGALNFSADTSTECQDINECLEDKDICGLNARCFNSIPNYSCICDDGFMSTTGMESFRHGDNVTCRDFDECQESVCGENAECVNTPGSYHCVCNAGFGLKSGRSNFTGSQEQCEDICMIDKAICGNGTCHRGASGHYCACHAGFTNYGNKGSSCSALNCDVFRVMNNPQEKFPVAHDLMMQLEESCLNLTESENPTELDGEDILKKLLSVIDKLLSSGAFNDNRKVSTFLNLVENALRLIGAFIKPPGTTRSSTHTELELLVEKGAKLPTGAVTLSSKQAQVDIQLETAAGDLSYYPGFTTVSLLSYANLEDSADGFFGGMKPQVNQRFELNSKVVTVSVSNRNTSHLKEPVKLTFRHLQQTNESNHTCVFWDASQEGGSWSARGCKVVESKPEHTVCSCNHLSSFAVLMALYEIEDKFELQLITWVGLSLSLICLFICILTFSLIRSIKSPRTTIHLHLCISLFIATVIFLAGISRTESRVGCAVIAGLLHFFFLAAFCWMCLEGIQLFRMVVLVFNTNFKTLYMMAGGYGVPAVIVAISALANAKGYGTKRHCWLNLDSIWSFFGPACVIIIVNVFFFLITVWKLAQKFSSLNPELDNLQKIKAFTITAVAQLCLLGTMWIFGCFQFEEGTIIMSYLFTIFGSFQGVMLFVMHCLFSKQVREEYGNILSRCCAPQKKSYSNFSYSQTSKAQASKSTQDTGESRI
ncbi:adhesion G protein-coupled receptor E2 [Anoplopoma fimbria]|uniref:adhesion G protein-coupled receptor E2 n=1 Tax=Anoplopoma fimbria TaxID=229290 RepID=UPI0023EDA5F9|nr:adhesion G protein-coupled receptor E2 [Anoplopoma fimbria]